MSGTLFLLPCSISDAALEAVLPADVIAITRRLQHFLAEDAKSARAYLKRVAHPQAIALLHIVEIGHAPEATRLGQWLQPLAAGEDIGLLSEAGCPAVADPGADLVAAAHRRGFAVRPLVGPSSILLAIMAGGLQGQRFRFLGYLPIDAAARIATLRQIERDSTAGETQVFIETPYRNQRMLDAIIATCAADTLLSLAIDLTSAAEKILTLRVEQWRQMDVSMRPVIEKRPVIFSLLANRLR